MKDANGLPQYARIADELRSRLRRLPLGAPFETEQEIAEEFGVSRGTVRQALKTLEQEGLLMREQGRGSFRAQPNESPYVFRLEQSFSDSIRKIGVESGLRKLSVKMVPAPAPIADMLHIPRGTKVRRVSRVRTVGGMPFAYGVGYLRADQVPQFFKRDYRTTLSDLVRNDMHLHIESQRCEVYAAVADEEIASALSVPLGASVLKLCFFCRSTSGVPMLLDTFFFPPTQTMRFESPL